MEPRPVVVKLTVPSLPEAVPLKLTLPAEAVREEPEPMLTVSKLLVALLRILTSLVVAVTLPLSVKLAVVAVDASAAGD